MEVKVVRVPGRTSVVELNNGATVQDALTAAEVSVSEGEVCKLNAVDADMSASVHEGDKIIIAKGAKGNS